ncbi:sigma-54-dependent Fis family transcriptional regulator [Cellvibrio zantedeschiae]|uniref:Sigma-54-dependent Fis family transcriptional regulator n=1 Tax=Cellvibrio zantedeschiae TaxID=1237077 RepID=A0ABQ3B9N4_9GAMM|nr:sigma-54 dependent transcriptional regulator [Cellvibrio zantedeschiae]GGY86304.1 sigma-54-dependent Fis family transcriptional regulator [Cellvibrio zantedeschiae]
MAKIAGHILVVDDDEDILLSAQLLLKRQFDSVSRLVDPTGLPDFLAKQVVDVVLLDMNFTLGDNSGEDGFYWLQQLQQKFPHLVIVLMTAYAGVELAVKAIKAGATDFVIKPWSNEKLIATLHSAFELAQSRKKLSSLSAENSALRDALNSKQEYFIGESPLMRELMQKASRCAPTQANVLILGENGSGKELLAREIHAQSARADNIFMAIDMGAISESLFESELFGHKKGAFTGAQTARVGRLVAANGGTLFLDEIGNLPMHLQVKLLRVLEQRQVIPVGDEKPIPLDVRIIAATNAPYTDLTDETLFRQDLLYRLNTVELTLPPLRQRRDDIPLLLDYYLGVYAQKYQRKKPKISRLTLDALTAYDWPGNVRSLRHAVERAVVLCHGDELHESDFALSSRTKTDAPAPKNILHLETLEKNAVAEALKKYDGNISQAAKELGLTRTALYRRMDKYEL